MKTSPGWHFALGFQPPELWRNEFLLFISCAVCGVLLQQPKQTKTTIQQWRNLQRTVLGERNQFPKVTCCIIPFLGLEMTQLQKWRTDRLWLTREEKTSEGMGVAMKRDPEGSAVVLEMPVSWPYQWQNHGCKIVLESATSGKIVLSCWPKKIKHRREGEKKKKRERQKERQTGMKGQRKGGETRET